MPAGNLTHVWKNESDPQITEIGIPVSDSPRDITLRFGITEMTADSREAIFAFLVNGTVVEERYSTWESVGTNSYIMRELLFEDVPGEVESIVMTMLSNEEGGDSFISGLVLVDLPCERFEPEVFCTYTQGFYGNEGGKTCQGWTTRELLENLMQEELIMGGGDNTFTIPSGGVDCVLELLPGGGPSEALVGHTSCGDMQTIETNKQGRLKNSLLAQGITLSLNLRLSPELMDFPLEEPEEGTTVADLLDLVNDALAGEDISPLSLSQVSDAATKVNEMFDECKVWTGSETGEWNTEAQGMSEDTANGEDGSVKGVLGISRDEAGDILEIYPNPVTDRFYLRIPPRITDITNAGIFDLSGAQVTAIDHSFHSGRDQVIEIDAGQFVPGVYFVRIVSGEGIVYKRFGVQ